MKHQGYAHVLGDFVNTDEHASDKYKPIGTPVEQIRQELFGDLRPGFVQSLAPGDFLVAGKGFGTVSSRVDASRNIRAVGICAVLARSFGMLFYRNAINVGLPCIACDTSLIADGERLEVDFDNGEVRTTIAGAVLPFTPFPQEILNILQDGGLVEHIRRHGDYCL